MLKMEKILDTIASIIIPAITAIGGYCLNKLKKDENKRRSIKEDRLEKVILPSLILIESDLYNTSYDINKTKEILTIFEDNLNLVGIEAYHYAKECSKDKNLEAFLLLCEYLTNEYDRLRTLKFLPRRSFKYIKANEMYLHKSTYNWNVFEFGANVFTSLFIILSITSFVAYLVYRIITVLLDYLN
jgi:hypothetical protein